LCYTVTYSKGNITNKVLAISIKNVIIKHCKNSSAGIFYREAKGGGGWASRSGQFFTLII
jgi:hypothetical protein